MRVTQYNFYHRFVNNQAQIKTQLNNISRQLSSGLKIEYGHEDPQIFADTLRLDYEEHTLTQAIEVSTDAQNFANNTDAVLFQMTDVLTKFKTLLVQAANDGSNSANNYYAISNELKRLKSHLIDMGNTSINGRYLFAGSAMDVKPLDEMGNYRGNDKEVKAVVGDGVELPYNIPGADLFLGFDHPFQKKVTTNHPLYRQIDLDKKASGEFDKRPDQPLYAKIDDTVEEMTGWDADTTFYISGRRHDGVGFKQKFTLPSDYTLDKVLEEIGKAFGNRPDHKVVDVELVQGRIIVTDKLSGSAQLDMTLIASDRDVNDIADLVENSDAQVLRFNEGGRIPNFGVDQLKTVRNPARGDLFSLKTIFVNSADQKPAVVSTKLQNLFPSSVTQITLNGTDSDGNSASATVAVNSTSTMNDLLEAIKNNFGVNVSLGSDGRIQIVDEENGGDYFSMTLSTDVASGSHAFRTEVLVDPNGFEKDGAYLYSDVPQIAKSNQSYATDATKVVDVTADTKLDNYEMIIDAVDPSGQAIKARIYHDSGDNKMKFEVDSNHDGTYDSGAITIKNADDTDTIEDSTANPPIHQFTMKQLHDVISLVMSGEYANIGANGYAQAARDAQESVHVALDRKGTLYLKDQNSTDTPMRFSIYDAKASDYSTPDGVMMRFQTNNALTVDTPHHNLFEALDQAIEAVENGLQHPDGATFALARNMGIQNAMTRIDHLLTHVEKEHTKIGAVSNSLKYAVERSETLRLHVQTLRSDVLDTDIAETSMRLNQLSLNYQALLTTVSKIQNLSLVNYMR